MGSLFFVHYCLLNYSRLFCHSFLYNNPMEQTNNFQSSDSETPIPPNVQSIQDLIDVATGKKEYSGSLIDCIPSEKFQHIPFTAIGGLTEAKLGLVLTLISPNIKTILVSGPSACGKSSLIRSIQGIMPEEERSLCQFGCLPSQIESDGFEAVCPECARKFGMGEPISQLISPKLAEYSLDDFSQPELPNIFQNNNDNYFFIKIEKGSTTTSLMKILDLINQQSTANQYHPIKLMCEINESRIPDVLPLIQKFDMFLQIKPNQIDSDAWNVFTQLHMYVGQNHLSSHKVNLEQLKLDIQKARSIYPNVELPKYLQNAVFLLIKSLHINSMKASFLLIETAKASAAADFRTTVSSIDIVSTASYALSHFMLSNTDLFSSTITCIEEILSAELIRVFPS